MPSSSSSETLRYLEGIIERAKTLPSPVVFNDSETLRYLEGIIELAKTLPSPAVMNDREVLRCLDLVTHYIRTRNNSREDYLADQNRSKDLEIAELNTALETQRGHFESAERMHNLQVDNLGAVLLVRETEIARLKQVEEALQATIQDREVLLERYQCEIEKGMEERKLLRKELLDVCAKFGVPTGNTEDEVGNMATTSQMQNRDYGDRDGRVFKRQRRESDA
ncbi:hypothetical protein VNI00_014516 [Paramarasmius palmivorus]|uniref:Uncharacterized protein n=1 Tax=Paramarasmius palmivorus TaxID=297713 RepID=A0AAW0BRE8_9AGAR